MLRNLLVLVVALSAGGCAFGVKHDYSASPDVSISSKNSVAVGVHDQRPYVVSANKTETFVGLSRGGYGNTFDVNTASDKPLADDFRATVVEAFKRSGVSVKDVSLKPGQKPSDALQALITVGQQRSLLLTLREWKSDTYMNTSLIYNVHLAVLDASGKAIAEKTLQGTDDLGGNAFNPPGHAKAAVPPAYKKKIEELLSSPEIKRGLQ